MASTKEKRSGPTKGTPKPKSKAGADGKVHPWRKCVLGQHWRRDHDVRPHLRKGRPVKGSHHKASCNPNKSEKDTLYEVEIEAMALEFFAGLSGPPKADDLSDLQYKRGNEFDIFIRGWTKYWNDVLEASTPLDANLIKALIATESSFKPALVIKDGKGQGKARGLMQVTDTTLRILQNQKGELKDHLVILSKKDMLTPNLNICAGIRWLFRKGEISESRRGSSSDWVKTIALYKGYPEKHSQIEKLKKLYERLKS